MKCSYCHHPLYYLSLIINSVQNIVILIPKTPLENLKLAENTFKQKAASRSGLSYVCVFSLLPALQWYPCFSGSLNLNYKIKMRKLPDEEGGGWFAKIPLLPVEKRQKKPL
jgi:hypothetical protein